MGSSTDREGHGRQTTGELTEQRLRHDVRQSLSAVMLLAAIVDRQPLAGPVVHETLEQMRQEVDWMTRVLAPAEGSTEAFVDVGEAVDQMWRGVATGRDTEMRLLRQADVWTFTDPVALGRAVRNLIENAIRAAGDGVVEVRVCGCNGRVSIEVHDSGPGFGLIRPQEQLGLITVRRFAAAYDGRFHIDSSPLGGALVRLELPQLSPVTEVPRELVPERTTA
jgi:signal transduction histidine kinase